MAEGTTIKATIAKLYQVANGRTCFITTKGYRFEVTRFDLNTLELEPDIPSTIWEMCEIVAGCFESRSTFKNVQQVIFIFNDKKISVKKEEHATPEMIYKKWYEAPYMN